MKRLTSTWLLVLLALLGAASWLYAQGLDTSKGSVAVEVQDSSGAVIQNAKITLSGPTGSMNATTDVRGTAIFQNLIPGTYKVKVEFEGFRIFEVQNLNVNASQRTSIQAKMEPGSITETVQVTESAAKVDVTSTTTGSNISEEMVSNLPVARNIAGLLALAPGVAPGGGTGTANPSISGASGLENHYIIDGINATDSGYGAFGVYSNVYGSMGTGVNFDFVKEVQVKTGGFEAQYGEALGGIVNVVTHSGTNQFHGAAYLYSSPNWAEAMYKQPNDIRTGSPGTEVHGRRSFDFGVNVGGPLIKNKLFWYGSFNPTWRSTDNMAPRGFTIRDLGTLPFKSRNYNWIAKLNYEITENHHLEGTAFGDPSRDPVGAHRTLLRNDLLANSSNTYGTRNWAVKYNGLLTAKTVLNGVFAWNHTYFLEFPEHPELFQVRDYQKATPWASYTYTGGVGYMENSNGDNKTYSFMLTRNTDFLGGHQFDIGYAFNQVDYLGTRLYSGPNWTIPAAAGIAAEDVGKTMYGGFFYARPNRTIGGKVYPLAYQLARGNFSPPNVSTETKYQNAFVQDSWQINRYVTAKVGVRWEQQYLRGNESTHAFVGNWAPRLGFIIDPKGDRKTKLFGNWGRFFEKIPQDLALRAMSSEMSYLSGYFLTLPGQSGFAPVPGTVFAPYGTLGTVIYPTAKAQYQTEMVAGFEHEFPHGIVVSTRFIHRNLNRILEDISGTTAEAANAGVEQQFVIANPSLSLDIFHNPVACSSGPNCDVDGTGFTFESGRLGSDGVPDTFPDPRRVYKAWEVAVEKRFGNNWSLMANYRLAKLFGDYEGLFRNDNGQSDPNITSLFDFMWSPELGDQFKVGVLPTDRRHIANIYASRLIKSKLNVAFGWTGMTGVPLSKLMAHPVYLNAGEVPVGGRGAYGRSPRQNYTDVRVDYRIAVKGDNQKLKLSADLFNVFNQKTISSIDQFGEVSYGVVNKDFMLPNAYHRPFYARFALRYEF